MKRRFSAGVLYGALLLGGSLAGCATAEAPPPPTAAQARAAVLDGVKASGPLPQEVKPLLDQAATAAFNDTFGPSLPDAEHPAGAVCYLSGCLIEITYRDHCVERASQQRLIQVGTARLRSWPGVIYHSPPQPLSDGSGRLQVTWALFIAAPTVNENRAKFEAFLKPPKQPQVFRPDVCGRDTTGPVLLQDTQKQGATK